MMSNTVLRSAEVCVNLPKARKENLKIESYFNKNNLLRLGVFMGNS